MDKYEELKTLDELRAKGAITEEEYQKEKAKILNTPQKKELMGMDQNTYLMLMHLSQFGGFLVPGLGFALPIVLWLTNNSNNAEVDRHGKNIVNFMISMLIYAVISAILIIVIIGIPMLIAIGILEIVFIIMAAVKASRGEYWKYPLSISFFK